MFKNKRSFFERLTGGVNPLPPEELEEQPITKMDLTGRPTTQTDNDWLKENAEEGELAVDVYQTEDEIVIKAMISGVKPEDLTISLSREMVTIRGERKEMEEIHENDYFQKELYWGAFSKTILLPAEVEPEEAEATEKHGLLILRLPKIDRERVQKLKVKSL